MKNYQLLILSLLFFIIQTLSSAKAADMAPLEVIGARAINTAEVVVLS